jgi:hypothetical protein
LLAGARSQQTPDLFVRFSPSNGNGTAAVA